ncbi:TetR/AcrR family transcriptional regulator [Paenibacillus sp. BK033]|uniref:TetR/AcrR family transcriptional regulator n=1 Tax=unclassified Paenibacillus TaxID=185978 RepID=UPI00104B82F7|nr:TetR/AcrR family transcriptional regulator [Paenibacillus sp. BK033]NIK70946.1 AcrR family transcriptional regulator [Paenibacillus sp. BK720]TCM93077.1 TetR family transcriptional regulator [Paenibacillus sp. BK033]
MNKKQQQTEQTKKKIADAARNLFVQKGYKATSIEDIVKATGCSAGNIYYHFKNKEGLFLHLIEDWNTEWEETWLAKEPQYKTTIDKLYGMAEHLAHDQLNHPLTKAVDEFFNNAEKNPEVEERINEMVKGYIDFNRDLLQRGIDSGEFQSSNVTGLAIILDSLMYGLNQHTRTMEREEALAAYRLAMDVFLHGIATPAR